MKALPAEWLLGITQGPKGWAELSGKNQAGSKLKMRLSWKKTQQTGSPERHRGSLLRSHMGQRRAELTADALPQEFH